MGSAKRGLNIASLATPDSAHSRGYFGNWFPPNFVNSLKGLDPGLSWSNLETIVSGTYSVQTNADSHHDVRLFSRHTRVAIRKPPAYISFCKSEPMNEKAFDASVNGHEIAASRNGQDFVFAGKVEFQENVLRTSLSPVPTPSLPSYSLRYCIEGSDTPASDTHS